MGLKICLEDSLYVGLLLGLLLACCVSVLALRPENCRNSLDCNHSFCTSCFLFESRSSQLVMASCMEKTHLKRIEVMVVVSLNQGNLTVA